MIHSKENSLFGSYESRSNPSVMHLARLHDLTSASLLPGSFFFW